jgi:hypothetical protein
MGTNSINPNRLAGPVYGLATALPARKLTGTEAAVADALWAPPAPPASVYADNDPSRCWIWSAEQSVIGKTRRH